MQKCWLRQTKNAPHAQGRKRRSQTQTQTKELHLLEPDGEDKVPPCKSAPAASREGSATGVASAHQAGGRPREGHYRKEV